MVIAGGLKQVQYRIRNFDFWKTVDVVQSDGSVCTDHGLPELPEFLEGFGMTSKKDRYIYICGGQKRCTNCRDCQNCFNGRSSGSWGCWNNCGMYRLRSSYIFDNLHFWSLYITTVKSKPNLYISYNIPLYFGLPKLWII